MSAPSFSPLSASFAFTDQNAMQRDYNRQAIQDRATGAARIAPVSRSPTTHAAINTNYTLPYQNTYTTLPPFRVALPNPTTPTFTVTTAPAAPTVANGRLSRQLGTTWTHTTRLTATVGQVTQTRVALLARHAAALRDLGQSPHPHLAFIPQQLTGVFATTRNDLQALLRQLDGLEAECAQEMAVLCALLESENAGEEEEPAVPFGREGEVLDAVRAVGEVRRSVAGERRDIVRGLSGVWLVWMEAVRMRVVA